MSHSGISIYYTSSDGEAWATYIQEKFVSAEYNIPTELNEFTEDSRFQTESNKANIFLISPELLSLHPSEWQLLKRFDKRTSMVILVGLDHADLVFASEQFHVPNILQWFTFEIEETEGSVRDMLICIISIYEGHYEASPLRDSVVTFEPLLPVTPRRPLSEDNGNTYEKLPCDRPRQVNQLCKVLPEDDDVFLLLEREAEGRLEVTWDDEEGVVKPTHLSGMTVYRIPKHPTNGNFTVTLDDKFIGTGNLKHGRTRDHSMSDYEYVELPNIPPRRSESQKIQTSSPVNSCPPCSPPPCSNSGSKLSLSTPAHSRTNTDSNTVTSGNKIDTIRELLQSETDPENTLCKCLGIERNSMELDRKMTSMVEYTETLKHISFCRTPHKLPERTDAVWPTLLHFGAHFNLLNFCEALLSNHLMHGYCTTPNKNGDLPEDIAKQAGHTKLAELLSVFSSIYAKADKHDSGFSADMPRLSTITLVDELGEMTPPRPHSDTSESEDDGYLQMGTLADGIQIYVNSPPDRPAPPPRWSIARSTDSQLGESFDDDPFEDPMLKTPTNMVPPNLYKADSEEYLDEDHIYSNQRKAYGGDDQSLNEGLSYDGEDPPFPNMMNLEPSNRYVESPTPLTGSSLSKSTPRFFPTGPPEQASMSSSRPMPVLSSQSRREGSASSDGGGTTVFKHKNITSYMGIDSDVPLHISRSAPQMEKASKGIMSKMKRAFVPKKKTNRSLSEPSISEDDIAALTKRHERVYRKSSVGNKRSSDTSSSSNSTYSETMSTIMDDPESESKYKIEKRVKKVKKKNKNTIKFLKTDARQSIRISKVMEDKHMTGPSLPPRRAQLDSERF